MFKALFIEKAPIRKIMDVIITNIINLPHRYNPKKGEIVTNILANNETIDLSQYQAKCLSNSNIGIVIHVHHQLEREGFIVKIISQELNNIELCKKNSKNAPILYSEICENQTYIAMKHCGKSLFDFIKNNPNKKESMIMQLLSYLNKNRDLNSVLLDLNADAFVVNKNSCLACVDLDSITKVPQEEELPLKWFLDHNAITLGYYSAEEVAEINSVKDYSRERLSEKKFNLKEMQRHLLALILLEIAADKPISELQEQKELLKNRAKNNQLNGVFNHDLLKPLNIDKNIQSMITFLLNPDSINYNKVPNKFKNLMKIYRDSDDDQLNNKSSNGRKCGIGLLSFGIFGDVFTGGFAALSAAPISNTAISAMALFFASNPYGWAIMGGLAVIAIIGVTCLALSKKSRCQNTDEPASVGIDNQVSINDSVIYEIKGA